MIDGPILSILSLLPGRLGASWGVALARRGARRRKARFERGGPFEAPCRIRVAGRARFPWVGARLAQREGRLVFAPEWHFIQYTAPLAEVRILSAGPVEPADGWSRGQQAVALHLTANGHVVDVALAGPDAECLRRLLGEPAGGGEGA